MNSINLLKRVIVSARSDPKGLIVSIFLTYSVLWTIVEPGMSFLESARFFFNGWTKFAIFLTISIIVGIIIHLRPLSIHLKIRNSVIVITFGDLFTFDGYKAIPVSRFMLETDVISTSLQGVLIRKFAGEDGVSGLTLYQEQLVAGLENSECDQVVRSQTGVGVVEKYYPLGTTANVTRNGEKYLLFALTKTEQKGCIEADNCSVTNLWESLRYFWKHAKTHARGMSVNIPLVGSGVSGIQLPAQRVLELNLLSIYNSLIEEGQITSSEIRIVLHNRFFDEIDLRQLKSSWSKATE